MSSLNLKQVEFTRTMAHFEVWCFRNDIEIIGAELFRSPEQAALNALPTGSPIRQKVFDLLGVPLHNNRKSGIARSVHRLKLGKDLFRVINGKVSWDIDDYMEMGEKWKTMHPLACWGHDFAGRDAVHFSFEHNGVR